MSYDYSEQDLVHIRHVVDHLEHEVEGARVAQNGSIASLNYWRARVTTILATPSLPMHVEKQARDLLGRLDCLCDARRGAGTGGNARSFFSAH
ncbi:hypothetical protein [Paraburkholderia unamae]|uniref:Uncharacterized protein n=1 Tax=Paraburkholderia unamae TaxID=219649 RepID=A0ABX5KL27_9BURK|nr:hypothetical protein [Paraburkholderia unamae]PVX81340.1 hypothetical protein C7402_111242 [Paraburkholderia unamae]RAR57210.1 hypothetical protein C7401_11689 [Paraburkholderia unamae]CAG9243399.1 conserved hypothetical protein [Paraburkholderia unamae]